MARYIFLFEKNIKKGGDFLDIFIAQIFFPAIISKNKK
jgi:hypothetical protein